MDESEIDYDLAENERRAGSAGSGYTPFRFGFAVYMVGDTRSCSRLFTHLLPFLYFL